MGFKSSISKLLKRLLHRGNNQCNTSRDPPSKEAAPPLQKAAAPSPAGRGARGASEDPHSGRQPSNSIAQRALYNRPSQIHQVQGLDFSAGLYRTGSGGRGSRGPAEAAEADVATPCLFPSAGQQTKPYRVDFTGSNSNSASSFKLVSSSQKTASRTSSRLLERREPCLSAASHHQSAKVLPLPSGSRRQPSPSSSSRLSRSPRPSPLASDSGLCGSLPKSSLVLPKEATRASTEAALFRATSSIRAGLMARPDSLAFGAAAVSRTGPALSCGPQQPPSQQACPMYGSPPEADLPRIMAEAAVRSLDIAPPALPLLRPSMKAGE